jgi:hypothetical protein
VKAVYLDGFKDRSLGQSLRDYGFDLFDGRTLAPATDDVFGLLAFRRKRPAQQG